MDIYIVIYGNLVVGASTKLQGAELIRAEEARRHAETLGLLPVGWTREQVEQGAYNAMTIQNTNLRDLDD